MTQWYRTHLSMQEPQEIWVHPWVGKIPWSRKCQPTPVCLPGKPHGWGSLADYNPWGHKESDTTKQLNTPPKACISLFYTGTLYHPGSLSYHHFCFSPVLHFYGWVFWWKLIVPSSVNVPAYLLSPSNRVSEACGLPVSPVPLSYVGNKTILMLPIAKMACIQSRLPSYKPRR